MRNDDTNPFRKPTAVLPVVGLIVAGVVLMLFMLLALASVALFPLGRGSIPSFTQMARPIARLSPGVRLCPRRPGAGGAVMGKRRMKKKGNPVE